MLLPGLWSGAWHRCSTKWIPENKQDEILVSMFDFHVTSVCLSIWFGMLHQLNWYQVLHLGFCWQGSAARPLFAERSSST